MGELLKTKSLFTNEIGYLLKTCAERECASMIA